MASPRFIPPGPKKFRTLLTRQGRIFYMLKAQREEGEGGVTEVIPTAVFLSSTNVNENASVGTVIGILSSNGVPAVTFAIVSDPDAKFAIVGNQLRLNAPLDYSIQPNHSVTISATNIAGSFSQIFNIEILPTLGKFHFNDRVNSHHIVTLGL